ncbi:hypothetical protein AM493_08340 [Flavobacterium akiainvivens]|uniref:Uncharacterized protein n=1 Tax=Flavobacterium akiainvivens TaxID=1202724 RepID=A0A0M8MHS5_9FLAO|nr:hypothetical protein AM493_08340 [Flavobacterium akiainvivens]SFQ54520.1 hypothetical protein SAMN05444144_107150 [Flavobacterium akiainvivens]
MLGRSLQILNDVLLLITGSVYLFQYWRHTSKYVKYNNLIKIKACIIRCKIVCFLSFYYNTGPTKPVFLFYGYFYKTLC